MLMKQAPYGIDARNSKLNLPSTITFSFSKTKTTLKKSAEGLDGIVFGHQAAFNWNNDKQPEYNLILNRVSIPFICSEQAFTVKECKSPFNTFKRKRCHQRKRLGYSFSAD